MWYCSCLSYQRVVLLVFSSTAVKIPRAENKKVKSKVGMARGPVLHRQLQSIEIELSLCVITECFWNKYHVSRKSLEVPVKHSPKVVRRVLLYCDCVTIHWFVGFLNRRTADQLILESGCMFEHPAAAQFRHHVLNGDWNEVVVSFSVASLEIHNVSQDVLLVACIDILQSTWKLRRITGFPLFWNLWKPGNVREFG